MTNFIVKLTLNSKLDHQNRIWMLWQFTDKPLPGPKVTFDPIDVHYCKYIFDLHS
uniref:Uncharacterized protein n=1 Tax=Arion vulgaris TaxID=1028688 RepID=A0A0B6Z4R3_9EUPU